MRSLLLVFSLSGIIVGPVLAAQSETVMGNQYTQSIQVVNLLANTLLPDPGMTPTSVLIRYYNGGSEPCWSNTLSYQDDVTIHAGPTQGCLNKVFKVTITPMLVAGKLETYQGPITVDIDTTKYANQITIHQERAPVFDIQSGLVSSPGTIKAKIQAQFASML